MNSTRAWSTDALDALVKSVVAKATKQQPEHLAADDLLVEIGLDSLGLSMVIGQVEYETGAQCSYEHVETLFGAITLADLINGLRAVVCDPITTHDR